MAQIGSFGTSYPDENKILQGCDLGYGYKAKQGWINVSFADNIETPLGMSEDDI